MNNPVLCLGTVEVFVRGRLWVIYGVVVSKMLRDD